MQGGINIGKYDVRFAFCKRGHQIIKGEPCARCDYRERSDCADALRNLLRNLAKRVRRRKR